MAGSYTFTPEEQLLKGKITLQTQMPFLGYLLMYMPFKCKPEVGTMGVDAHGNIYYNPEWVKGLSEAEVLGVEAHEVLHIVRKHLLRNKGYDPQLKNSSDDICNNQTILALNMSIPKCGWLPVPVGDGSWDMPVPGTGVTIHNVQDKCSEEIYDELMKIPPQKGKGGKAGAQGQSPGGFDVHMRMNGKDPNQQDKKKGKGQGDGDPSGGGGGDGDEGEGDMIEAEGLAHDMEVALDREWLERIAQAATIAKQKGNLPGCLAKDLDELMKPKVNWKALVYKFVSDGIIVDYNFKRPHKKSALFGYVIPSYQKEMVELVCHIDSSGSMMEEIKDCTSELYHLLHSFENIKITLLFCDAQIQGEPIILSRNNRQDFTKLVKPSGFGGTSHMPVIDWLNKNGRTCKLFISMTDGCSDIPQAYSQLKVNCRKLLLITKNGCDATQFKKIGMCVKLT